MVEVTIDSIRVSLMSQHRIVVLKELDVERYLAIWIGPDTAESITMELQKVSVARPMTHDLLRNVIRHMKGKVSHIIVNSLDSDVFYAQIVLDVNGQSLEVDARPSDALALAVRMGAKIFVSDQVMNTASIRPELGLDMESDIDEGEEGVEENLDIFRDFVESLDLDDFDNQKN
jgi:hypothetical protein